MAGNTLDIDDIIEGKHGIAEAISNKFTTWDSLRGSWLDEKKELRNYLFATDTTTTSNSSLPWRNSTTRPKLTQIRDNLEANYMSALFPNDEWLTWASDTEEDSNAEKRQLIESYMRSKTRPTISPFRKVINQLILDFIDNGNAFATTEYLDETRRIVDPDPSIVGAVNEVSDEDIPGYVGPMPVRISPMDIVFNPLASSFEESPKILRSMTSMGEIRKDMTQNPEKVYQEEVFQIMRGNREKLKGIAPTDIRKSNGFVMDGFSSMHHYYSSGSVELLEFIGDFYDEHEDKLYLNHIITVADRRHVLRMVPNPTWRKSLFRHVGWRLRPDNLYAMGPLDNLVGMQYRIDHLENLKADAFDQIAVPLIKIKGNVEDFEFRPGERIYTGEDGDVEFLRPDTAVLQTNLEIQELETEMEIMAGAPREAMGIRTPGEKTAFEVQRLDAAASRTFQRKINAFEMFLENILNDMLSVARRQMNSKDLVPALDSELGVVLFQTITKDDLNAKGHIYPIGARHFAHEANQLQNMVQFANSALGQDPSVNAHVSGLATAQAVEKLLNFEKFGLVRKNIRIEEQAETQQMIANAQRAAGEQEQFDNMRAIEAEEALEPEEEDETDIPLDE